jgi:hypothetical protein
MGATLGGSSLVSVVGNTSMAFNIDSGSTGLGNSESSAMSDVTGAGTEDNNQNSGSQQMINEGEGNNNDFTKKIYKAKRFKPQPQ